MALTQRKMLACLLLAGCLPRPVPHTSYEARSEALRIPSYVIFQDTTGALSYHASTRRDLPSAGAKQTRVEGKACQTGLQLPVFTGGGVAVVSVGWGEGAYRQAIDEARKGLPAGTVLYDLRADVQSRTILLVYREQCLIVNAASHKP